MSDLYDYQYELSSLIARQIASDDDMPPSPLGEDATADSHRNGCVKTVAKEEQYVPTASGPTAASSDVSYEVGMGVCDGKRRRDVHRQRGPKASLEGVVIQNRKHLNVERKKHRIQFQKNHNKVIYSYFDLTAPIDFAELFEMVLEHQHKGYSGPGKSFHFIRVDGEVKIVTFKEKRKIKKMMKDNNKNKDKDNAEETYNIV